MTLAYMLLLKIKFTYDKNGQVKMGNLIYNIPCINLRASWETRFRVLRRKGFVKRGKEDGRLGVI